jgi:hypothetical protein
MNTKIFQRFALMVLLCGGFLVITLPVNIAAQYRGDGTYFIVAKHSGMFLDVRLDNASSWSLNSSVLQQYVPNNGANQKFIVQAMPRGTYVFIVPVSGVYSAPEKCLDIPGSALGVAGVQQSSCTHSFNQQFVIETAPGGFYKIRVRHSGLYFDIEAVSLSSGARLNQYPSNGGDNQLFQFIRLPSE